MAAAAAANAKGKKSAEKKRSPAAPSASKKGKAAAGGDEFGGFKKKGKKQPEPDSDSEDEFAALGDDSDGDDDLSGDEPLDGRWRATTPRRIDEDEDEDDDDDDDDDDDESLEGIENKSPKDAKDLFSDADEDDEEDEDDEFAELGDDSDEDDDGPLEQDFSGDESGSESESDEETLLPIEKKARKEDARRKREAEDAAAEQVLNIEDEDVYELSGDEDDPDAPPDLQHVQARIQEVVRVLQDFKSRREPGRSRGEYVERLVADLATYYGYNTFLIQYFLDTFSVAETMGLLEANETQRPVTLRTNTLKCRRRELAASASIAA